MKRAPWKKWTMLTYIAGDNDLSDEGVVDLEEMEKAGASPSLHVGVQLDTKGEHDGAIRYEIGGPDWTGSVHRTVIERLKETDTGSPKVLSEFLGWGRRRYRSRFWLLVVWGHGNGFKQLPNRSVATDGQFLGHSLTIPQVSRVLGNAGFSPKKKLSVLGFDSCMMCMFEIANHLSDQVEYLVGSQQSEPGAGWPYKAVLCALDKARTSRAAATQIVREYGDSYRGKFVDVTQSAIQLDLTDEVVEPWNRLGRLLASHVKTEEGREAVRKALRGVQSFDHSDYVDLVDLATRLASKEISDSITDAARETARRAKRCVLKPFVKIGDSVKRSNGLSVWLPRDPGVFGESARQYRALKCNRKKGWLEFLQTYVNA